jgi:hypothetical protein
MLSEFIFLLLAGIRMELLQKITGKAAIQGKNKMAVLSTQLEEGNPSLAWGRLYPHIFSIFSTHNAV